MTESSKGACQQPNSLPLPGCIEGVEESPRVGQKICSNNGNKTEHLQLCRAACAHVRTNVCAKMVMTIGVIGIFHCFFRFKSSLPQIWSSVNAHVRLTYFLVVVNIYTILEIICVAWAWEHFKNLQYQPWPMHPS